MNNEPFGKTGMKVSRVGLGTFLLGKPEVDEDLMGKVIGEALDRDVNLIDTADTYFDSELRVGKALAENGMRDRVFLCTKLYKVHAGEGKLARNCRSNIVRGIEESLRRLRTDHVDVYLLHHPDSQARLEETLRALDAVVKSGKARYVGASNHYAWQLAHAQGLAERLGLEPFSVVQNCYNVVQRVVETEYLHYVRKFGLGLMVYSPLGVGLLTGDFAKWAGEETKGQAGEFRRAAETRGKGMFEQMMRGLMDIARELNVSLAQLAMMWVVSKKVVSVALLGATKVGEIGEIVDGVEKGLSAEAEARIDGLTEGAVYMPYRNQPEVTGGG